ncbi:MAG: glycosyltransferase family 4 protein [Chloroflexi bacterium]|nr:glycosyltransferase family 4 protein [Chloroflexota bacterium]
MRILLVAQRYGTEVVGGSESHARLVAQRLARRHDVTVATTTALDHWTWATYYTPGASDLGGVRVLRFDTLPRDPRYKEIERHVLFEEHTLADEYAWLRAQGPHAPRLLDFIHREGHGFQAVLFYTYIYEPTALGLPLVPERAALVSTAHDELPLRLAPYRALFQLPRAIGPHTPEELALVRREFHNDQVPAEIVGMGLGAPPNADGAAFRARHGLDGRVVVYVGQVTQAKAVDELLGMWSAYRDGGGDGTLVLVGNVMMEIPARDDVRALGRVSEEEKWAALAAADALVLPSHLESLGIVLLEAWQVATPVLVPAWNAVTAGQTARSHGGVTYADRDAFAPALASLLEDGRARGEAGRAWVERECAWPAFDARVERLLAMARFDA